MKGEIYIGDPCRKCGSSERYAHSGQCRRCKIRIATARNNRLREERKAK